MSTTDYALLFATSLLVGLLVGFVAKRVSDVMEQDEEADAERLRVRLGVDRNGDVYPGRKDAR